MSTIFRDRVTLVDSVNSWTLNDTSVKYGTPGATIRCDLLGGWDDTAEPSAEVAAFGYSDGVSVEERFPLKEQYYLVGGYVVATSRMEAEQCKEIISQMFAHNRSIRLTRNGPIPKSVDLRRVSKVEFTDDVEVGFRWIVTLMAPWPYKLGMATKTGYAGAYSGGDIYRTYSGPDTAPYRTYAGPTTAPYRVYTDPSAASAIPLSINAINEGTAAAYPIFNVIGPLPARSWQLLNEATGESTTFELDLSDGQALTIDTRNKQAWIGLEPVDYYVRGDWIRLIPGANTIRLLASSDSVTAMVQIEFQDTYTR